MTTEMTFDKLYDMFMANYGTKENFIRSYGGPVNTNDNEKDSGDVSDSGLLNISFSRPIQFPYELLKEFDAAYEEQVPPLEPTDEEIKMI